MKRLFCFIFSFIFLFLIGCSNKKEEQAAAFDLDLAVAEEIESIDNINSFDDETIKALAIVVRTKKKTLKETSAYIPKNERIYNIVKETNDGFLKDGNKTADVNFEIFETWEKQIKKYDILKYLSNKGISLANLSDIEKITDENGNLIALVVGGKTISFEELKKEFKIPTNNVTDLKINKSDVVLTGKFNENDFNLTKAEKLSKQGKKHSEILKFFYKDFSLSEK